MRSPKSFGKIRIGFDTCLGSIIVIVIVKIEVKGGVPKHVSPIR
jgi:hypothetical protein